MSAPALREQAPRPCYSSARVTQRSKNKPRCYGCGLTPEGCVCALLPKVRFATPIAIVQHIRERFKPTNTGRLFANIVEGTALLPYGMREPPFDPGPLVDPGIAWRVLYPREDAPVLDPTEAPPPGQKFGYVVLDGTWHQCSRMTRRVPVVMDLPCVALPPGEPAIWTVRTQHDPRGMSTFEAALRVLELVEGKEATRPVREAFALVTARMLYLKGKLRSPDVPAEWHG